MFEAKIKQRVFFRFWDQKEYLRPGLLTLDTWWEIGSIWDNFSTINTNFILVKAILRRTQIHNKWIWF